jgi:hypothetical protein
MLDVERAYFERTRAELEAHFSGRFVVIKDEEVIGAFNTIQEALSEGTRRLGLNSFLVRQVGVPIKGVSIPALALGILRADPTLPDNRPRTAS